MTAVIDVRRSQQKQDDTSDDYDQLMYDSADND